VRLLGRRPHRRHGSNLPEQPRGLVGRHRAYTSTNGT